MNTATLEDTRNVLGLPETNWYAEDSISELYNEIKRIEMEQEAVGRRIITLADELVNAHDEYEFAKSNELLEIHREEQAAAEAWYMRWGLKHAYKSMNDGTKAARYRSKFRELRKAWRKADYAYNAHIAYSKALAVTLASKKARAVLLDPTGELSKRLG